MDGVIILSEHIYREISLTSTIIISIILFLYFLALCYAVYREFKYHKKSIGKRIIDIIEIILVLPILIGLAFGLRWGYTTINTKYEVCVSDSVTLNEFTSQYKIISYNGNIYTVEEIKE